MHEKRIFTAFSGDRLVVSGDVETMVLRVKEWLDTGERDPVLIFEDQSGQQVNFDFHGTTAEVLAKLKSHPLFESLAEPSPKSGPGRPNLGVTSREVTLLPRHWDWLSQQPSGASATMRRLIDEERKRGAGKEQTRMARDAAAKFMWVMAGNRPHFEEASRALYAKDRPRLESLIQNWPADIRNHLRHLIDRAEHCEREHHEGHSV